MFSENVLSVGYFHTQIENDGNIDVKVAHVVAIEDNACRVWNRITHNDCNWKHNYFHGGHEILMRVGRQCFHSH